MAVGIIRQGLPVGEAQEQIFKADCKAIRSACVIVAVLDGRTIDEGVAFEIGYGYGIGKTCFGLKADDRVMLPTGDNPMILKACVKVVGSAIELIKLIEAELEHKGKLTGRSVSNGDALIGHHSS